MTGMLDATQWGRVSNRWVWRGSVGGVYGDWGIGAAVETGVGTVVDWTLRREGASGWCCCCRCFFDVVVVGGGDVGCLRQSAMKIGSCWWRV